MYLETKVILEKVVAEIKETKLDILNVIPKDNIVIIQIKMPNMHNNRLNIPTLEIKNRQSDMTMLTLDIKYQVKDLLEIYEILKPLTNEA